MAENILNIDPKIDLKQCLLWQYQNSEKLKSLILSKEEWYQTHQAQFWQDWYDNVFNLDTANDFGLSVWGEILDFSRNVTAKDGSQHYLTTEQYRLILKGQILRFGMGATAPEINNWLATVFAGQGAAYCLDSYDMTAIPFVLRSDPSDEIKWLLGNIDFFPRPAGVGYEVRIVPNTIFGFNGSGLQPFNQGVFSNDYSNVIQPSDPDMYQLSINAPAGATVTINGESVRWALVELNESYSWSVSQTGYVTASGSGTMREDTNINISALQINNTAGIGTSYINNQEAEGAFFQTGTNFAFTYSVGANGYIPASGSGTISNNRTISISRVLINPTPAGANVTLNGQNARGAFFVTGTSFAYSYVVSYPGLVSTRGNGYATSNTVINAQAISGNWQINNIATNETGGVSTAGTYTVPFNGTINLTMAAEAGRYRSYDGGYGAKATVSNISVNQGDVLRFMKISGAYANYGGWAYGGSGIALYINDNLQLVVGGGGGADTRTSLVVAGGGGYVGGYSTPRSMHPVVQDCGYSIDGTRGDSMTDVLTDGDGALKTDQRVGIHSTIYGYGGSGYNVMAQQVVFSTNQEAGFVNLTFNPR